MRGKLNREDTTMVLTWNIVRAAGYMRHIDCPGTGPLQTNISLKCRVYPKTERGVKNKYIAFS